MKKIDNTNSLAEWLSYIESLHSKEIDMGLERTGLVLQDLCLDFSKTTFITVAGTNGKGSVCAFLEAILSAAGWRVGCYSSPHFIRLNERIKYLGQYIDDASFVESLYAVNQARANTSLTYFEFITLAALHLYAKNSLDVVILEVGMGGRLDAVNIVEPDCSIVTTVDIDHTQYLGQTRDAIALEKAHIYRKNKPAICVESAPAETLVHYAQSINADLCLLDKDFRFSCIEESWSFYGRKTQHLALAYPSMRGKHQIRNAAGALAALEALHEKIPITQQAVRTGLARAVITGRFQVLPGTPRTILDVAHNPQSARCLQDNLLELERKEFVRYRYAVFGVMSDKDVDGIISLFSNFIDYWLVTCLPTDRAMHASEISNKIQLITQAKKSSTLFPKKKPQMVSEFEDSPNTSKTILIEKSNTSYSSHKPRESIAVLEFENPLEALSAARVYADTMDQILVFGSFFTVAGVL